MGYTTTLKWQLDFSPAITDLNQIKYLNDILWKDLRDSKGLTKEEYVKSMENTRLIHSFKELSYIGFELTPNFDWIQWNKAEKFYDIVEKTQFIIEYMKLKYPEFWLIWYIECQWEDFDDRWLLKVENNIAKRIENPLIGYTKCPECDHVFKIN